MRRFGLKNGIYFAHFGLETSIVFEGTTVVCERIRRFSPRKKGQYANSMSFCWRSNLSDDDIISAFINTYVAFCDLLQV